MYILYYYSYYTIIYAMDFNYFWANRLVCLYYLYIITIYILPDFMIRKQQIDNKIIT